MPRVPQRTALGGVNPGRLRTPPLLDGDNEPPFPVGCPLSSPSNALIEHSPCQRENSGIAAAYTTDRAGFVSPFGFLDNNYLVCII